MAIPLGVDLVESCLLPGVNSEAAFATAFHLSLAGGRPHLPGGLSPTTGHVAESVTSAVLKELGFELIWQLTGPGTHGVDLLMLDPAGSTVVAWEVKGTLRRTGLPRLSGRERRQMDPDWLDTPDNPGMAEWGLEAADLLGGIAVVRFAHMEMRLGVTADYKSLIPIRGRDELVDLTWAWA